MKYILKKYLGYILCAIVLVLAWLLFSQERAEKERYKATQTALLSDVAYYKTENERNVASVRALTLTKSEIEMYNKNLADLL